MTIALTDTLCTGSTAEEIIIDAFGMLTAIDINESGASPAETAKALRALNGMRDGWANEGLAISDVTRSCTVDGSSAILTNATDPLLNTVDVLKIAPGMNVSGTGIPASTRVLALDDRRFLITLDQLTTVVGTSVTIAFAVLPFQAKFTRGIAALLAMEIAPLMGMDNIPPMVARLAQSGWAALQANYMRIPPVSFDPALAQSSMRRTTVITA